MTLDCDHKFCLPCMRDVTKNVAAADIFTDVKCPVGSCGHVQGFNMEHLKSMEDLQKLVTEALDKEDEVHQKQWEMQNLQNLLSSGQTKTQKAEPQFICQEGHGEVEFYCKKE